MRTQLNFLIAFTLWLAAAGVATAQGTAIAYDGRLNDNGGPANGNYDLTFTLFGVSSNGTAVAGPLTNSPTAVSNGLFMVTLEFGAGAFPGAERWLEIAVRTNGGGVFTTLSPRQKITAAPYAITAGSVTGNAGTATTATNLSGPLAGDVTGTQGATVVTSVGGQSAASIASGASGANGAASGNTASAIVKRDASGNFAAGTITANLAGNATTATAAGNFTGPLAGDVTGPQGATVVSSVGGQGAANVASGSSAANAATSANTAGTIVRRDGSGNFSAGAVTAASVNGDGSGLTSLNASQLASGTVNEARLSANVPLRNANNVFTGSNNLSGVTVATNAGNILNGTFAGPLAGNVTGDVIGNLTGNATTATTAGNFTGSLAGDVTGTQSATAVASVGGQSAASIASGVTSANAATAANNANAVVRRDASGNFAAGAVSATSFAGDGSGLTGLNGSSLASGTVADARLSGNVPLRNANQSFTGANSFANSGNSFQGGFAGDGGGLINLNGANIVSGTVGNAQLAPNAVQMANIASGAVGNTQLASGAAVANLQASGQSGVASEGVILSTNPASLPLLNAGYVQRGKQVFSDFWDARDNVNAPSQRALPHAVWTGTEWILWGGLKSPTLPRDGARYNPTTDAWTPISTNGAPSGRFFAGAVWSGTEMLVWGGWNATNALGDGARYNPTTDIWTPMSTNNAPAPRFLGYAATAIWSGSEMLIWGGQAEGNTYYADGKRYNPNADTWTTMATSGAPTARNFYMVAWSGAQMIIWGGINNASGGIVGNGTRYSPSSNSWSSMSASGALSARFNSSAVWTGSKMIIWAGSAVSGIVNDGSIYDPTSDSWSPIRSSGAPSARLSAPAIWTGSELVVWGGATSTGSTASRGDGGRLNASGVWGPLPLTDGPAARQNHVVCWTGDKMLLFGGDDNVSIHFADLYSYALPSAIYMYMKP